MPIHRARVLLRTAALAAVASITLCSHAFAAVYVGELPPSSVNACSTTNSVYLQRQAAGSAYTIPSNGVMTMFFVTAGSSIPAADQVSARLYRNISGANYQVIGETTAQSFTFANGANLFPSRVPVVAGDLLALHLNRAGGGNTGCEYTTSSGQDVTGDTNSAPVAVGGIDTFDSLANRRVNISARIEADADEDGYGDESQDLCPEDAAHSTTACSGVLLGSTLQSVANGSSASGSFVDWIQSSLPGALTVAPFDGVVVRWRIKHASSLDSYGLRVMRLDDAASATPLASSDMINGPSDSRNILTVPARLPVAAGQTIALKAKSGVPFFISPGIGTIDFINPAADTGVTTPRLLIFSLHELLVNADVEPDADHDGYGDVTQDTCPTETQEQSACAKPVVGRLRVAPSKFCPEKRGAAIAAICKRGARISFDLSKDSRVSFKISRRLAGKRKGTRCVKPSSAGRRARRCVRLKAMVTFTRSIPAATVNFPYSARHKRGRRTTGLVPGPYRLIVTPVSSASGVAGQPADANFSIMSR
ncbi:MAG: hypothetical protein HY827_02485 [Actinobacteria bacterium]|nr:hypothetical protein [Actinomycetota bacterium]